jgi:hypothetical protein
MNAREPVFSIIAVSFSIALSFTNCGTRKDAVKLEEPPIITSATYQHTLYNGKPQPIDARAARNDTPPFIITYFPTEEALLKNEGGTTEPPAAVGSYYARIERPAGNGYAAGRDISVEYAIQKAFVTISAEKRQEAVYDGDPKHAASSADVPVDLVIRYYPSEEARSAGDAPGGPPTEPGIYFVTVSYDGDENYRPATKDVEFTIRKNE